MTRTYQTEFPDYPASDLPAIPAHWKDESWHNDTCPSFTVGNDDGLAIYVDYADAAAREFEGAFPRFSVQGLDQNGQRMASGDVELFASDDWEAVLAFVASHERIQRMKDDTLSREDAEELLREEMASEGQPCPDFMAHLRSVISGAGCDQ